METIRRQSVPARLPIAIGEWLMVLPAVVFLAAAALRDATPSQYEPARTSWIVFEWFAHMPRPALGLLLIGLPSVVVIVGCATSWRIWREDRALREDATAALAILRRQLAAVLLATALLLAGVILAAVLAHMITD